MISASALILVLAAASGLHGRQQPPAQAMPPCNVAPPPPTGLVAKVERTTLTLSWKAPSSGAPTNYSVEAGNASGSTYLGIDDTGSARTSFTKSLDPGIYFIRVRAANNCGASGVSSEVRVVVD